MSSTTAPRSRRASTKPSRAGFRPDIQGLRAFAVLAVIADHLFAWPTGGFVGVDIFFVISGFLITGILLKEFQKTGHISFTGFYARRIRRIVPATILVIGATLAAARALFLGNKFDATVWDSIASFFFFANWRFASTGTDYFAQGGAPSPLQHFWSLSVEEQFYFVWPWLMLGILVLATKALKATPAKAISFAGTAMGVIIVGSLAWAFYESAASSTVAYFSLFSRTWELGIGAILAIFASRFASIPTALRPVLAWIGIGGMFAALFIIDSGTVFPAPGALLPVLSAGLVIVSSAGGTARWNFLLVNPAAKYIGDISYSLYLWHFPVIVFTAILIPDLGLPYFMTVLAVTAVLSITSYHVVEKPMNLSPLFKGGSWHTQLEAWKKWRKENANVKYYGLGFLAAATVAVVGVTSAPPPAEEYVRPVAGPSMTATSSGAPVVDTPGARAEAALKAALKSTSWPATTSPSVDNVIDEGTPDEVALGCGRTNFDDPSSCSFGNTSNPEIVVYGDSLGMTLMPTVRAAFEDRYHVRGATATGCAVIDLDVVFTPADRKAGCLSHRDNSLAYINKVKPVAVFVIENYNWSLPNKLTSGATGAAAQAEWKAAAESFVQKASPSGAKIIFVSPPPEGKQIADCYTPVGKPSSCESRVQDTWTQIHQVEPTVPGTSYIDTMNWFCTDGKCPILSGDYIIKRDFVHPTQQYARNENLVADFREKAEAFLQASG
ncbi:acyltransferase family protein [Rathayibacter iranicus]|uniref:Peptidoglycan/LPS O-acetylase OafA/YrhL n=2 Tax=Rathayibacter iranicus TaxID=59737 RepID=A0ABX5LGR0_9MICO|nr:acyltransferase family protein [Rathayibacter iranicus]MWV30968.1 acyltransferase family protein [Rathayibacter iranicus NCPPB 2253 = VKM Ac-1602]PPI48097.1 acyltransferase [Rathayibacter iranicus]PPI61313.1 acyltransferase [Rathayibacter iranicus]PPI72742.1 acyltransferase [Rathayibacter iranicus]PWJ66008.1 peptidoglycan/LPS O-acetylase OafA/YrhL [Rathayibacter iranicus NCPPB 2253 = VKM Ac-1602]